MDKYSDVRDLAYSFFIQEVPDLLQQLETGLLEIGQNRTTHQVHTLMRLVHTIKGGAAGVGLQNIQQIAHLLEDCLRALYNEELKVDPGLESLFLKAYDCLRIPLEETIRLGKSLDTEQFLNEAGAIFATLQNNLEGFLDEEDRLSTAAEYGIDIVRSIFEVDIEEGLQRLESISTESTTVITGELRAQAQVFIGIADLVQIKVLEEIANLVIEVLDRSPEKIQQLLPLALADFRLVQESYLLGTTSRIPPSPSEALQNLLPQPTSFVEEETSTGLAEMFGDVSLFPEETSMGLAEMFGDVSEEELEVFSRQSLDETIRQIQQEFTSLPAVNIQQTTETPVTLENIFTQHPVLATHEPAISVRLEISRLELINNQLGELSINRSRLAIQHDRIKTALNELSNRFTSFKQIEPELKNVLDKLTIAPTALKVDLKSQFDVLELDNYSAAYSILQYAVEQLIQLEEALEDAVLYTERSTESIDKQKQILTYLQNDLLSARMLPLNNILSRFPRILRDLSLTYQKSVQLELLGVDTLTDKAVLDKLFDPLLHLVRNAFDHGIEPPQERLAMGKTAEGHISIQAYSRGNRTFIQIKDDGDGIDPEKIKAKAINLNIISPEIANSLSDTKILDLIFESGFSTASTVTELSGRGVGLDIVRSQVRSLKGDIYIDSKIKAGTVFTLSLPLTISVAKLLVIQVKNAMFALSSESIEQILVPLKEQIRTSGGQRFLTWQEQLIPIYTISDYLNYRCPSPETIEHDLLEMVPHPVTWLKPLLIFREREEITALEIDQIVNEEELVIKPLKSALRYPHYIYGCTIIGEGTLVPVIDIFSLLNKIRQTSLLSLPPVSISPSKSTRQEETPVILIVDDSAAMRQTLTITLQKSGYIVLQASDGRLALEELQRQSHRIKLIICDIEMPNLNGFEFLTHRRANPKIQEIPVIMLTSRSSDKHRNLAFQLGTSAYITKPYLETDIIEQIQKLLTPHLVNN